MHDRGGDFDSKHEVRIVIRSQKTVMAALLAAGLLMPAAAIAGLCGDNVEGVRVACSCGDIVVSDTSLRPDDPVVSARCTGDGLIVRAPAGAVTLHLDLNGQSVLGTGSGTGIRVVAGGRDGAVVTGGSTGARGVVAGFATGMRATGRRALAEVSSIDFNTNTRDGVALWGSQVRLIDVGADTNGRDGVHMGGRQSAVEGVRANGNARYGVRVTGADANVDGKARNNRRGDVVGSPRSGVEDR
jgi:hypothetical protein